MRRSILRHRVISLLSLAIMAACSDTGTEPTMASVAGTYNATSFATTSAGSTTNQLARGATLTLLLSAQGTVTGTLFIPADGTNGTVNESMAGSWALNGSTVSFTQSADTFVRDMDFTSASGTLVGDHTFGSTRVQITLTRQ